MPLVSSGKSHQKIFFNIQITQQESTSKNGTTKSMAMNEQQKNY